jgi:molybdopterin-guanine dinucleotide biosynthesis protein A
MIEHVLKALRGVVDHIIIVTNSPHLYKTCNVTIVTDAFNKRGPLTGIYTGLLHSTNECNVVVACDMPFLDAGLIREMAAQLPGYDAVAIPGEPLHAAYSARILPVVERQIATGNCSMNHLLSQLRVKAISGPALININTPQEWEALCRVKR